MFSMRLSLADPEETFVARNSLRRNRRSRSRDHPRVREGRERPRFQPLDFNSTGRVELKSALRWLLRGAPGQTANDETQPAL